MHTINRKWSGALVAVLLTALVQVSWSESRSRSGSAGAARPSATVSRITPSQSPTIMSFTPNYRLSQPSMGSLGSGFAGRGAAQAQGASVIPVASGRGSNPGAVSSRSPQPAIPSRPSAAPPSVPALDRGRSRPTESPSRSVPASPTGEVRSRTPDSPARSVPASPSGEVRSRPGMPARPEMPGRSVPASPTGDRGISRGRVEPVSPSSIGRNESPSSRGRIIPSPTGEAVSPRTPDALKLRENQTPLSRSVSGDRGRIGRPAVSESPRAADVNSGLRSQSRDGGAEHHGWLPPLPPPPPLPGMSGHDYRRALRHHYDNYADHWFGGHSSWRHFIHLAAPAPWFWTQYPYVYRYPWVYGYYEPAVYASFGLYTPSWYGQAYYPWWDWCDAPFVYYYYRYPARFSFNLSIGDDYGAMYTDYASGAGVDVAFDRPLGVWVPGHYEQDAYGEWVWVPGYYTY